MSDANPEERPVVEYGAPPRRHTTQLVAGHMLGLAAAAVLVVGTAWAGAYIDTRRNSGEHLAGLAGLMVGAAVGLALVLTAAVAAILFGRRRGSALLRGTGQGLFLSLGLGVLWAGICAVM